MSYDIFGMDRNNREQQRNEFSFDDNDDDGRSATTSAFSFSTPPSMDSRGDKDIYCVGCRHNVGMKRMSCSHCVCNTCLKPSETGILCPLCFSLTPFDSVRDTSFSMQQEKKLNSGLAKTCRCSDSVLADFFCVDCDDFLCTMCKEAHGRVKIAKGHFILELSDNAISPPPSPSIACRLHPENELSVFCQKCHRMTCSTCQSFGEHKNHSCTELKNQPEIQQGMLREIAKSLPQKTQAFRAIYNIVLGRARKVEEERMEKRNDVRRLVEEIQNAVAKRVGELMTEIDRICDTERNACARMARTTCDMLVLSAQVKRVASQSLQKGCERVDQNDVDCQSGLHSLNYIFDQLRFMNSTAARCDVDQLHRPILSLSLSTGPLFQSLMHLGTFHAPTPPPPSAPLQHYSHSAPRRPPLQQMAQMAPTYTGSAPQFRLAPISLMVNPKQFPPPPYQLAIQQQQSYLHPQPRQQLPPQPPRYTCYQQALFHQANYAPNRLAPCSYQLQYPPSTVRQPVAEQLYFSQVPAQRPQQQAIFNSGQYQVDTNAPNIGTAPTPPANNSRQITPPPPAPNVQRSPQISNPSTVEQSIHDLLRAAVAEPSGALPKSKARNPRGKNRAIVPKPATGQKRNYRSKAKPSLYLMVVDPIVIPATYLGAEKANSSSDTVENPRPSGSATIVNEFEIHTANDFNDTATTSDVLHTQAPSPVEMRLIIDEADSGIESAITVEENTIDIESSDSSIDQSETVEENRNDAFYFDGTALKFNDRIGNGNCTSLVESPKKCGVDESGDDKLFFLDELCSVCNTDDGRRVRICANKRCGRVFHGNHHVPIFEDADLDSDSEREKRRPWLCTFCAVDFKNARRLNDVHADRSHTGLNYYEVKACERILLELYTFPDSILFHEAVHESLTDYYTRVSKPMDFSLVRQRLADGHYAKVDDFVVDMKQIFLNCFVYYEKISQENCDIGTRVGGHFWQLVQKYFPESSNKRKMGRGVGDNGKAKQMRTD